MSIFIRFTDKDGDPLALTNEVSAVYLTEAEKTTVANFPGQTVLTAVRNQYTVINHRTGNYTVRDSFDEVMGKIEMANEVEEMAREGNRD